MHAFTRILRSAAVVICTAGSGCGSAPPVEPSIAFTTIPPAAEGGSEKTAPVAGRVTGARAGQRIVLYSRSDVWWVQPLTDQPFTRIEPDATWKSSIHLGTEYAALLVEDGYRPANTREVLPRPGDGVIAVASVKGRGDLTIRRPKVLTFSGYEWEVRDVPSDRGGANDYDPANAWTDSEGLLHLRLAQREGRWTSAEVVLTRALGYGTYRFTVRDVSTLDPAAAFGMFTWDSRAAEQNHRELDVEVSRWGDPRVPNAQYVLQPFYLPANVSRFSAPRGTLTHSFRWEPGRVAFSTVHAARAGDGAAVAKHEFTAGVPTPGDERVRMNLYYFRFAPAAPRNDVEVVIERFRYLP
jgi:hypothetical protein